MDQKLEMAIYLVQGGYSMKEASLLVGRSKGWLWTRASTHKGLRRTLEPWIKHGNPKKRL